MRGGNEAFLLRVEAEEVEDDLGGFLHTFEGHEFHTAVEVVTAGEKVGAGQAHKGEPGSVRAAANGLNLGRDAFHFHRLDGFLDDKVMRLHL